MQIKHKNFEDMMLWSQDIMNTKIFKCGFILGHSLFNASRIIVNVVCLDSSIQWGEIYVRQIWA
jgi:hypothetical protein